MSKEKITDDDVRNEFIEIKNGTNKGLIFILIVLITILAYLGSVVYFNKESIDFEIFNNKIPTNNNGNEIDDNDEEVDAGINETVENNANIKGQTLNANVGTFILTANKDLYFEKNKFLSYQAKSLVSIGKHDKYDIKTNYNPGCDGETCLTDAYKLEFKNIISLYTYKFGNGEANTSIILIDEEGKVNEIIFKLNDSEYQIEIHKNVFNHDNILYMLETSSLNANYVLLVDKDGNQYPYYGVDSMKEFLEN